MEKIIQLTEKEYKELTETAQMNADEITRKAELLWETKGIAKVKIEATLRSNESWYYDHEIKCSGYTYVPEDQLFTPPVDFEETLNKFIQERMIKAMQREYGKGVSMEKKYQKAEKDLNKMARVLQFISFAGWGAFIGCLMYLIFS